jgi:hypothetical protein
MFQKIFTILTMVLASTMACDGGQVIPKLEIHDTRSYPDLSALADNMLLAGDADGNGAVEMRDAIYSLEWLFLGGPPPVVIEAKIVHEVDDSETRGEPLSIETDCSSVLSGSVIRVSAQNEETGNVLETADSIKVTYSYNDIDVLAATSSTNEATALEYAILVVLAPLGEQDAAKVNIAATPENTAQIGGIANYSTVNDLGADLSEMIFEPMLHETLLDAFVNRCNPVAAMEVCDVTEGIFHASATFLAAVVCVGSRGGGCGAAFEGRDRASSTYDDWCDVSFDDLLRKSLALSRRGFLWFIDDLRGSEPSVLVYTGRRRQLSSSQRDERSQRSLHPQPTLRVSPFFKSARTRKKPALTRGLSCWLPGKDSNLETEIQSLVCYQLHHRASMQSETALGDYFAFRRTCNRKIDEVFP